MENWGYIKQQYRIMVSFPIYVRKVLYESKLTFWTLLEGMLTKRSYQRPQMKVEVTLKEVVAVNYG